MNRRFIFKVSILAVLIVAVLLPLQTVQAAFGSSPLIWSSRNQINMDLEGYTFDLQLIRSETNSTATTAVFVGSAGIQFFTGPGSQEFCNFQYALELNQSDVSAALAEGGPEDITVQEAYQISNSCSTSGGVKDDKLGIVPGTTTVQFADAASQAAILSSPEPDGDGEGEEEQATCESASGALGWIMCPVVSILDGLFDWLSSQIEAMLLVRDYRSEDLREAWVIMRNFAYLLLIPSMLIMVISTALGFEFISAYTVKSALPRMVIAALFIALSWEITGFIVEITHVVGAGIRGLVLNPFGISSFREVFSPTGVQSAGQGLLIGGAIAITALSSIVLGIVGTFLGGAALILLTIFVFLVARQLFIIALIIIAPLAIISWIFPGKTGLWSVWWNFFTKLLFIYPIIMLMTAVGLIFAHLLNNPTEGLIAEQGVLSGAPLQGAGAVLTPIMKIVAFVAPYALIPLAFKYVGGVIGNLAGMVNDRNRGAFDRLKAKRQGLYSQGWKEAKAGTLANRGGKVGEKLGGGISTVTAGPKGWIPGERGKDNRAARRETARVLAGAQQFENDKIIQAHKNNDKFLTALSSPKAAQEELDAANESGDQQSVEAWRQAIALSRQVQHVTGSTRQQAAQAWAATGYNLAPGARGYRRLAEVMAETTGATLEYKRDNAGNIVNDQYGNPVIAGASGPNAGAYANAMNQAQYNLKNAGRFDLGGINDGQGYNYVGGVDKAGGYQAGQAKTPTHIAGAEAFMGVNLADLDSTKEQMTTLDADGNKVEPSGADVAAAKDQKVTASLQRQYDSGQLDKVGLIRHHENLLEARQSPTGGNKKEIDRQLNAIRTLRANLAPGGAQYDPNAKDLVDAIETNEKAVRRPVDPNKIEET